MENNIKIGTLTEDLHRAWDEYVHQHPSGTFFHLAGWKSVIENVYNHPTFYLLASQNNKIVGLLPLGHIRSRLFGNALISSPFCVYGGPLADNEDIREKLETEAERLAFQNNVDYLELRNITKTRNDWPVKELYVTFRKEIDPDPEVNMKAIPRRQRRMVRLGIQAGLKTRIEDSTENFFKIYATSVRNHGTPVFPSRYFKALKSIFEDKCEIRVVEKDGVAISSVMSFYFRDEVLPYYGGGLLDARKYNAFDFMYWDLMQTVCQQGVKIYDYGRSKIGTGSYSFKKNWGFTPAPLQYQFRLVNSKNLPDINPLNPKYQLFIKMWQKLPLALANRLGPILSRSLG